MNVFPVSTASPSTVAIGVRSAPEGFADLIGALLAELGPNLTAESGPPEGSRGERERGADDTDLPALQIAFPVGVASPGVDRAGGNPPRSEGGGPHGVEPPASSGSSHRLSSQPANEESAAAVDPPAVVGVAAGPPAMPAGGKNPREEIQAAASDLSPPTERAVNASIPGPDGAPLPPRPGTAAPLPPAGGPPPTAIPQPDPAAGTEAAVGQEQAPPGGEEAKATAPPGIRETGPRSAAHGEEIRPPSGPPPESAAVEVRPQPTDAAAPAERATTVQVVERISDWLERVEQARTTPDSISIEVPDPDGDYLIRLAMRDGRIELNVSRDGGATPAGLLDQLDEALTRRGFDLAGNERRSGGGSDQREERDGSHHPPSRSRPEEEREGLWM